ncbi:MAG: type IV fimbrial biogenesis protein FimT [Glaciecola sp.]|jgi:type IV fimbrial biogenesis protein FimT
MRNREPKKNLKITLQSRLKGTTLIEVMLIVSILAILGAFGVPSFLSIITKSRITSETNQLNGLIRFARFKAIEQEQLTVLCPTSDYSLCNNDWNAPKIVFIDTNHNNKRDTEEPMLMSMPKSNDSNQIYSRSRGLKFYDSGITASPASLRICPGSKEAKYARLLTVSLQGKIKISEDRNGDGIHENSAGVALSCL